MEPEEQVQQQMQHFIEQCCSTNKQAQQTAQEAHHATEAEQLYLNDNQWRAEAAHAKVVGLAAAAAVAAITAAQVPAAIPHAYGDMPRGNRPEGTPKYEGEQAKTWKPGCYSWKSLTDLQERTNSTSTRCLSLCET